MPVLSDDALDQLFRTARSYNGYTDRTVGTDELHAIWDLMKMGPTSANQMPARIVWCVSDTARERLAGCMGPDNGAKIMNAPVTAIIGTDEDFHEQLPMLFPHNPGAKDWFGDVDKRRQSALVNSTLQGAYLLMAARAVGLDTGPMVGFDAARVDAAFFADTPSVHVNFVTTIGHGDPASIFGRLPRPDFETFNRIA